MVPHNFCVEMCGEGASLACPLSAEENRFISEHVIPDAAAGYARGTWVGLYQTPGSEEPAGGWDNCVSGQSRVGLHTPWGPFQPENSRGTATQEDCAIMVRRRGLLGYTNWFINASLLQSWDHAGLSNMNWFDVPCQMPFRCVCELGAGASPESLAAVDSWLWDKRLVVILAFGVINPLLWALPAIILLCYRGFTRYSGAPTTGPREDASDLREASVTRRSVELANADAAAGKLRMRVSGAAAQLGWMILLVSTTPTIISDTGMAGGYVFNLIGNQHRYLWGFPWGTLQSLMLARPNAS